LVISLDQAVAAPFAASRLADAGARVIKVERPGGDFARAYDEVVHGQSSHFVWLNRGKESIELDIKAPEDAALLERMIARADVVIQNLAPGAFARAGFGSDRLRRSYPQLITCDISGYGEDGPQSEMKAYDLLIQAESGLASVTGGPEAPGRVGVSIVDIAAGMYALVGILEALHQRQRTGAGTGIKVSLFDAIADWMMVPLLFQEYTGQSPRRVGLNHPSIAPYGAFAVRGGKQVVISIQNEREWVRFCATVLEQPALAEDPRFNRGSARVENRAVLDPLIAEVFAGLDHEAVVGRLQKAKIAYANLNGVADLLAHPALRRAPVATPGGDVDVVASPIRFSDGAAPFRPVPGIGADTSAIRAEFAEPALKSEAGE
jgi:crotonobetainyl-CoA:carnitine CoA-transferase CaiB-like acyl-CoA transferase